MLLRLKNTYLFFVVLSPIMNPVFSVNPTQTENESALGKLMSERLYAETGDIHAIIPKEIKKLKEKVSNISDENIKKEINIFICCLNMIIRDFLKESLDKLDLEDKDIMYRASEYRKKLKLELEGKAAAGTASEYLEILKQKDETIIPNSSEHLRKLNANQLKINDSSEYAKELKSFHLLFQEKYLSLDLSKEEREICDDLSKLVIKLIDGEEKRIKKLEKKKNILSIFKDLFSSLWIMFTLPFRLIFRNLGIS